MLEEVGKNIDPISLDIRAEERTQTDGGYIGGAMCQGDHTSCMDINIVCVLVVIDTLESHAREGIAELTRVGRSGQCN